MTASFMRSSVRQKIFAKRAGVKPSSRPERIAEKKQPDPVAESQLKSYRGGFGSRLGYYRSGAIDRIVQIRHVPAREGRGEALPVRHSITLKQGWWPGSSPA